MSKNNKVVNWVKEHKTKLIITGVAIFGTVLVVKNWDSIKGMFKTTKSIRPNILKTKSAVEEIIVPVISSDILDNLTGNKLTARALGNKVWCSAQEINKRIVAAGLAIKLPCGEYVMTEAGRMIGKNTLKTTAVGHTFSNIEWDEKILELIFSPEELLDIATRQERARQIFPA